MLADAVLNDRRTFKDDDVHVKALDEKTKRISLERKELSSKLTVRKKFDGL